MADDPDLASLHDNAEFNKLVARLRATSKPVNNSRHLFTFDELGLIPEGIARDAATERYFFGSMRNGNVFSVDRHGQLAKFAAVEHEGKLAAIGMTVDAARQLLWVIGTRLSMVEGFDEHARAWSGVFGFDLGSGKLVHKFLRDDVENGFNDVTVGPGGDLYLSGSIIGTVAVGGDEILKIDVDKDVYGGNGIVATPDGKYVLTSSYPVGIAVIALSDGRTHYLGSPEDVPLYGIDGLYWYKGDLLPCKTACVRGGLCALN
jgi:sugar lactone lactonase YvrE